MKIRSTSLLVSSLLCSALLVPVAATADSELEKTVEYRQGVMNILSWNSKAIGAMLKGENAYDADSVKRHAADINRTAMLDIKAGFPEDSEHEDSAALADIWMDFATFEEKLTEFQNAAANLDKTAQSGDQAAVGAAMKDLGASCKGCHKKFKN
jgi:cytochrome c556